jgi:hypothetical protein
MMTGSVVDDREAILARMGHKDAAVNRQHP